MTVLQQQGIWRDKSAGCPIVVSARAKTDKLLSEAREYVTIHGGNEGFRVISMSDEIIHFSFSNLQFPFYTCEANGGFYQ
jgi:hypothetical protein